jgi:hypothetical protein
VAINRAPAAAVHRRSSNRFVCASATVRVTSPRQFDPRAAEGVVVLRLDVGDIACRLVAAAHPGINLRRNRAQG